ncbi:MULTISPECIES: hypothetical protein [Nocardiaceae]|uniref:hypothetical protein n=1 Tax=Nocardiaceae TaxID=85025 RepID=UPI000A62DF79|nr:MULTISPECIES: hypothetical protein [Rhodococcus]
MNLYERISAALADPEHRLSADVFEECATSLLSTTYPNLVPVRGGSDSGRDADLIQLPGADPIRMAITSSRTERGARANLRTAMASLTRHGLAGIELISVSLAELNEAKRVKLDGLAKESGYHLHAVVDRGFFADRLLIIGEWRQRLLGLRGGPFSLSRVPATISLGAAAPDPIGREDELDELQRAERDVVVWGVPGVGKSALLSRIQGLFFVEAEPSDEQLLGDILETQPTYLAVDDAMRRLKVIEQLVTIRRQEQLDYVIMAVCWPHEVHAVGVSLPVSVEFEVSPLIRSDIAQIVRSRGVNGEVAMAHILTQAQGRPGWAVYLADLAQEDGGAWGVYGGSALYTRVLSYLERSGLRTAARDSLALIALLGSLNDSDIPQLAGELGVARADLTHSINDVAVGGLLDVARRVGSSGDHENVYSVAPEVLVTPIVTEYFFSRTTPVLTAREVFRSWPSKRLDVALAVLKCTLAGNDSASATAHRLFHEVVDEVGVDGSRESLLRHYLHLGPTESSYVVDRSVSEWSALGPGPAYVKGMALNSVIMFIGDAITETHLFTAVDTAADVAVQLHRSDEGVSAFWTNVVNRVRGFGPAGTIRIGLLAKLWAQIQRWAEHEGWDRERTTVAVSALRQILHPMFDASWMSAEDSNVAHLASVVMPADAMTSLAHDVWALFVAESRNLSRGDVQLLVDVADEWSRVARGFGPHSDTAISRDQAAAASLMAVQIADFLIDLSGDYPGIRAQLRALTQPLGKDYQERDPLIAALFEPRTPGTNWTQWHEHTAEQVREQITPYLGLDPEVLCQKLSELKPEFEGTRPGLANRLYMVFHIIAQSSVDQLRWLNAAKEHNLLGEAHNVLTGLLGSSALDDASFLDLLNEPVVRSTLVNAALTENLAHRYFGLVENRITPQDIGQLELVVRRNEHAARAIKLLLTSDCTGVPAATAAALLAASDDDGEFLSPDLHHLWLDAVVQLEVPMGFDLHGEHDFFEKLLRRAPQVYEGLFVEVVRATESHDDFAALDVFGHSGYKLGIDAKTRVLSACESDSMRRRVFWALNGGDVEWVVHLLETDTVDDDFILYSANAIGPAIPIHELARILIPRGVEPRHIATLIEHGTYFGERHERLAGHLDRMAENAQSPEPAVALVGRAGVEIYEPRLREAREENRRNMIRGRR